MDKLSTLQKEIRDLEGQVTSETAAYKKDE